MKIIKAKIKVTHDGGATQYVYPQIWLDNVSKIPQITYPNDRTDEVVDKGSEYQIVYPVVPDDLYTEMLSKEPDVFSVADQVEFEAYSDKHYPQKEVINDTNAVLSVLAKAQLGEVLTKAEKDVLDPKSAVAGVTQTERVIDTVITKYGATF